MLNKKKYDKNYYKKNKKKKDLITKLWNIKHKKHRKEYLHNNYIKNKEKTLSQNKKRYEINKVEILKQHKIYILKNKYNLTPEQYDMMVSKQKHRCAICGLHQSELLRRLDIDHNHKTNVNRGLLCNNCNRGIGVFKDSIELLDKAKKYLQYFKRTQSI